MRNLLTFISKSTTAKSGIWYLVSDFLLKGMAFITIPVFTRLLTVEEYGIVSVYSSFVAIMAIVSGLDLHAGIGRAAIDFEEDYPKYLSSVISLSFAVFLVGIVVISAFSTTISSWIALSPDLVILATITGYGSFVFGFYNSHLLYQQKYKQKSLLHVVKAIVEVVLAIVLIIIIQEGKYYGKVYSSLTVSIAFILVIFPILFANGRKIFFYKAWKYAIRLGIPLVPHSLSSIILSQFDRLAIQGLLGPKEAGLYSMGYNVGMILILLIGVWSSTIAPWFYRNMKDEQYDRIQKVYVISFLLMSIVNVVLLVISPELIKVLSTNAYLDSIHVVPFVNFGHMFLMGYHIYVGFQYYHKRTVFISIGSIIAGLVNIGLNYLFIPVFGYVAAAATTALSYALLFLYNWFVVSRIMKKRTIRIGSLLPGILVSSFSLIYISVIYSLLDVFSVYGILTRYVFLMLLILSVVCFTRRRLMRKT